MQHVFITGIAGFLGSHLADRLLAEGYRVSGCDHLRGGYRDNVPEGAAFTEDDCCDLPAMKRCLEGVDILVHAASAAYEGLSVFSPSIICRDNVQASATVFAAAADRRVKRILYCSSMSRYGANEVPFTEDMQVAPCDPYAIAKVAAEELLKHLCETHGMQWSIAIPHNIIGARQKYDDPYRNVASIMANLMLQGRQPYIYGDGEQKRAFSPVPDVVDCLMKLVVGDFHQTIVNVGPEDEFITVNELARRLARIIEFPDLAPNYVEDRPCEVKLATCSAERAKALLGYEPRLSLDDGLRDIVDYIRARGTRPFQYHLDLEIVNERAPRTWRERLF